MRRIEIKVRGDCGWGRGEVHERVPSGRVWPRIFTSTVLNELRAMLRALGDAARLRAIMKQIAEGVVAAARHAAHGTHERAVVAIQSAEALLLHGVAGRPDALGVVSERPEERAAAFSVGPVRLHQARETIHGDALISRNKI